MESLHTSMINRVINAMEDYLEQMAKKTNALSNNDLCTEAVLAGNKAILQIEKIMDKIKDGTFNDIVLLEIGTLLKMLSDAVSLMNEHFTNDF